MTSYIGREPSLSQRKRFKFNISSNTYTISGADSSAATLTYNPGILTQVYKNGLLLNETTDYTASNGTSITFVVQLTAGNVINIVADGSFTYDGHYDMAQTDGRYLQKLADLADIDAAQTGTRDDLWMSPSKVLTAIETFAVTSNYNDYQIFTSSGTWNRPLWCDGDEFVFIECWGGGGGGASAVRGGGGGGGAYNWRLMRISEVTASVTVTVGAGGSAGSSGGNSSFASYLRGYGGGGSTGGGGGGGGGMTSAGNPNSGSTGGTGGAPMGGTIPSGSSVSSGGGGSNGAGVASDGGDSFFGGAGGGSGISTSASGGGGNKGGNNVWGGGGGSGGGTVAGGVGGTTSLYGGAGGASNSAGSAPGGGGGGGYAAATGGAGARGEVRIRVWR